MISYVYTPNVQKLLSMEPVDIVTLMQIGYYVISVYVDRRKGSKIYGVVKLVSLLHTCYHTKRRLMAALGIHKRNNLPILLTYITL